MVIRLGQGFWVDASDGLNWVLRKGEGKSDKKKADAIGYYSTLSRALGAAVERGAMVEVFDGDLGGANAMVRRVATDILGQVDLEFSKDELRGTVFRVTERAGGTGGEGVAA
jgi:hypothetical protein